MVVGSRGACKHRCSLRFGPLGSRGGRGGSRQSVTNVMSMRHNLSERTHCGSVGNLLEIRWKAFGRGAVPTQRPKSEQVAHSRATPTVRARRKGAADPPI